MSLKLVDLWIKQIMILKILEIKDTEGGIWSITGLASAAAFAAVKMKIPNKIDLVE